VDVFIQFMHLLTNGRNTSILKSQNADAFLASAQQQTALLAVCEQRCKPLCPLAGGEADAISPLYFAD
ncbi:hypothetical protein, partial [Pusillibacter faecalis]|uniref:hypothetical protein n=1 Tax=Pusillibacter faecalis TaxID=2714358 RepID=UPI00294316B7